ncbi:hypothetical protein [Nitriliruptor alkaliphilus]|uniref:hypothetical protein n=1 Tax=Nitriliruptor alkaliphilus TaxID=427918 RepID=UPI00069672FC|nr:hypothetical protein [Nitriliruptor alkaliphilus]
MRSTTPLAGFEYTLYLGEDDEGVFMATSTTGSDGETDFAAEILEVDETYTVCEPYAGRQRLLDRRGLPDVQGGARHRRRAALRERTVVSGPGAVLHETGFTNATIDCGEGLGEELTGTDADEALELDHLPLGDHQCTISISNGGPGD